MLICNDPSFVFVKTMKTAGTSIEIALSSLLKRGDMTSPLEPDEEKQRPGKAPRMAARLLVRTLREKSDGAVRGRYPHHGYKVAQTYLADQISGRYSFCVERNPYDKAISAFHFVASRRGTKITDVTQQFEGFCKSKRLASFSNFHMYADEGGLHVDRVLQYSNLADEFDEVMQYLKVSDVSLANIKAKTGLRPKLDLSAYFGTDFDLPAANLVEEAFVKEIEFFGYVPPETD